KWARGTLGRRAEGYSDIWWCEAKNGPTVYLGKGEEYRKAYRCQLCGQRLVDDPNRHDFVVHIEKSEMRTGRADRGCAIPSESQSGASLSFSGVWRAASHAEHQ